MKKTSLTSVAIAFVAMGLGACGHGDGTAETDTTVSSATVDSITATYGEFMGAYFNQAMANSEKYDDITVDKKEFLKGLRMSLSQEHSLDFIAGVNAGLQISEDLRKYKENGIELKRSEIIRLIDLAVLGDSVSEAKIDSLQRRLFTFQEKLNEKVRTRDENAAARSPQGIGNDNAGKRFARDFQASHSGVRPTESGLLPYIENPGGARPDLSKPLLVNIHLRHVDGTPILGQDNAIINVDGQPEGIREALGLMGTQGKGAFVLPPSLAWGAMGLEQAGVGPNEWIVAEIELFDNVDPEKIPYSQTTEQ